MMDVVSLARKAGFDACFVLKNESFPFYKRRLMDGALESAGKGLVADPQIDDSWANALLLLLKGYYPYTQELHVSGNYLSSNLAYHGANALLARLKEAGIRAERIYVPIRELALRSGIGTACLNGLTAYEGFGTRVAVQTLAVYLPDVSYTTPQPQRVCNGCGACARACPSGAIDEQGYHFERCARAYMGREAMPMWAMDCMDTLLGCEHCQFVCPLNAGVPEIGELPSAFDLGRILAGEIKPVLEIVGKNLNAGGRIYAQAIVLAVRQGRRELFSLIEAFGEDERPAVKSAYGYYLKHREEPV